MPSPTNRLPGDTDLMIARIKAAVRDGIITQAQVLAALHEVDPEMATYATEIQAARDNYTDDDCEIDAKPLLSVGDDGVWVSAWVFVHIAADEESGLADEGPSKYDLARDADERAREIEP